MEAVQINMFTSSNEKLAHKVYLDKDSVVRQIITDIKIKRPIE